MTTPFSEDEAARELSIPLANKSASMPCVSQNESPLMCLPSEIRVKILEDLLVSTTIIGRRQLPEGQRFPMPPPGTNSVSEGQIFRKFPEELGGYGLTPAILTTCQKLLHEGSRLLYGENTIGLQFHCKDWRANDERECYTKSCTACFFVYAVTNGSLLMWDNYHITHSKLCKPDYQPMSVAMRFKRFHIDLNLESGAYLHAYRFWYQGLDLLRDLLKNQSVTVQVDENLPISDEALGRFLQSSKLLRCKEFKVLGVPHGRIDIAEIEDTVTSTKPIIELVTPLGKLYEMRSIILKAHQSEPGGSNDSPIHPLFEGLEVAARDFDKDKFCKIRAKVLDMFDKAVNRVREEALKGQKGI